MLSSRNYYEILGVKPDAPQASISHAFHQLMKQTHSDKTQGDDNETKLLAEAYSALKYPEIRKKYDQRLEVEEKDAKESKRNIKKSNYFSDDLFAEELRNKPPIIARYNVPPHFFESMFYLWMGYQTVDVRAPSDHCKLLEGPVGAFEMQGVRIEQQDSYAVSTKIVTDYATLFSELLNYAVFNALDRLQKEKFSETYKSGAAVRAAFSWITEENAKPVFNVMTGHVGDTSAFVLVVDDEKVVQFEQLTQPHTVQGNKKNRLRVHRHSINMSRSIGDVYMEDGGLTHTPEVLSKPYTRPLEKNENAFLIVACDGLTDFVTHQEIIEIVGRNQHHSPEVIAKALVDFAFSRSKKKSKDNITVLVSPARDSFKAENNVDVLSEGAAIVLADGHGPDGAAVAKKVTKLFFGILRSILDDLLMLSGKRRQAVLANFQKQMDSLLNEKRAQAIQDLLQISIPFHTFSWVKGKPNLMLSLSLKEKIADDLLNDIEKSLGAMQLPHSRYVHIYNQIKILEIPLAGDLSKLPPAFDTFLIYLKALLEGYVPVAEKEVVILAPAKEGDLTEHPVAPAVEEIKKSLNLELKHRGKFENKNFPLLDPQKVRVMTVEKVSAIPALAETKKEALSYLEEKKNVMAEVKDEGGFLLEQVKPKLKLNVTYSPMMEVEGKIFLFNQKNGQRNVSDSHLTYSKYSETFIGRLQEFQDSKEVETPVMLKVSRDPLKTQNDFAVGAFLKEKGASRYIMLPKGIFYSDTFPDNPFVVTDSAQLGSLDRFLNAYYTKENEKLPYEYLLKLGHDIAKGLALLHESGVWHGDFRTENIYIDEYMGAKISGFGFSIPAYDSTTGKSGGDTDDDSHLSAASPEAGDAAVGSQAPELLMNGGYASEAGDIYALGGVLKELFSPPPHQKMFAGKTAHQIILHTYTGERDSVPACPVEIQEMIKACWSLHPSDRPTAKFILETFEKLIEVNNAEDLLANGIDHGFSITSPIVYRQRSAGSAMDCDIDEDLPPREKLFALLKASHLASPQQCGFVRKTEYPEHLAKEYEALIKSGLDNEKFFNAIKTNLQKHQNTEPLMADVIRLLQEIDLKQDKYYKAVFEFPKEKAAIYGVLSYLQAENIVLCTTENFDFIIEEVAYLSKILPQLKALKTLDQASFERVMLARGAEARLTGGSIKQGQAFLTFKPAAQHSSSVDLTVGLPESSSEQSSYDDLTIKTSLKIG
jgi:serine/threonine protein phosphatase PrpC/serine/threonine protein kinase